MYNWYICIYARVYVCVCRYRFAMVCIWSHQVNRLSVPNNRFFHQSIKTDQAKLKSKIPDFCWAKQLPGDSFSPQRLCPIMLPVSQGLVMLATSIFGGGAKNIKNVELSFWHLPLEEGLFLWDRASRERKREKDRDRERDLNIKDFSGVCSFLSHCSESGCLLCFLADALYTPGNTFWSFWVFLSLPAFHH